MAAGDRRAPADDLQPTARYGGQLPAGASYLSASVEWARTGDPDRLERRYRRRCRHLFDLVRREHGVAKAERRRMVVPPHPQAGQAVQDAVPAVDGTSHLREVLVWAQEHLEEALSVDALAVRALVSPRSFTRHVRAATGSTPHAELLGQRVSRAQSLLQSTDLSVDEVARRSRLGAATTLW